MNFNKTVIISHCTEADLKEITWDVSVEKLLTSGSAHANHLLPQ